MHVYRDTDKGQVTLPKNIRDFLQVREGDYKERAGKPCPLGLG
jgi:bifunctional DNA-binding transcriptional regulator/antitoxin component of YhaV-PrlF toxin-antitoxin module